MMGRQTHCLIFLLCLSIISASPEDDTNQEESSENRAKKQLGVFNVVKFPNQPCGASSGYNGTCYTASECTSLGGSASGTCASSFGVCCVFSLSCGSTTSQNNTYPIQTTYTTGSDADPCTYTFCRSSTDVAKIKIDFTSMTLEGPYTKSSTISGKDGAMMGDCMYDQLTVKSPGHASPPVICGVNTGQHMFVPMSDQCVTITIDIDSGLSGATTRSWSMKVTQYEVGSLMAPADNCLQYHTANYGSFGNFNWDFSVTDAGTGVVAFTQFHLSSQKYDICFRRKQGYCSICYSPYIMNTGIAADASSFGVGTSSVAAIRTASTSSSVSTFCTGVTNTDTTIAAGGGTIARGMGDYLEIQAATSAPSTSATVSNVYRICGQIWNSDGTAVVHSTICTFSTPFRIGVHFDDQECITDNAAATYLNRHENSVPGTEGSGHGYDGFYLSYWQNVC